MKLNRLVDKKITLNAGTIIIGILIIFVTVMGAIYLSTWVINPIWSSGQPPDDNNPVLPSSSSPAVPAVVNTKTISPELPSPTLSPEILGSETPAIILSETSSPTLAPPSATATNTSSNGLGSNPDDWAKLIGFSPADGSYFAPYAAFTKIWTLKNIGTTTWTKDYDLVFISGSKMSNKVVFPLPNNVKPGNTIKISLPQIAPKNPGTYQGLWMLGNKSGEIFGIGDQADQPLKTKITVLNVDPNNSYDFLLNYCQAIWWNSKGETISCPGEPKQIPGFVFLSPQPNLENGYTDKPVLWVHTDNKLEGIISGRYPAYKVMNGDHFKAKVGCMAGYPKCNVTFKLLYSIGNNPNQALGTWKELYGGGITTIDVDLSPLAGQSVQFTLRMSSTNNYPTSAQGFWMRPRIFYLQPTITPTASNTPTVTNTPTETPTDTPLPVESPTDTPEP